MMPPTSTQNALALFGRALIALLFVPEGFQKIGGFDRTVAYITAAHVPLPEVAAAIAIVVELGLGLMLLVGWQTRWAALAIAFYVLVITFIFHPFWSVPAAQEVMQKISFFKNLGLVGGLLGLVAWGPGELSMDASRGRTRSAHGGSAATEG